jgi:membrane protease YdiL (CAAX protease family)
MTSAQAAKLASLVRYAVAALIAVSTPPLLAMPELKWLGWALLGLATIPSVMAYKTAFGRHMLLLIGMLALLGLVPVDTTITYSHGAIMGGLLALTILVPYFVARDWFKEKMLITFPFRTGRKWYRKEIGYIIFAGVASYFILPFYLGTTGSYLNWDVELGPSYIIRLFIGTNALGIWDELFFVGICLALLRRHLPFWFANIAQATMWTAFLYELGFRGWGPFVIFFFALTQGLIFKNTKSVLYIITVHLTLDFVLFLTLIHLNHPEYLQIFITSPF